MRSTPLRPRKARARAIKRRRTLARIWLASLLMAGGLFLAIIALSAQAQQRGPGPRQGHVMAFDAEGNRLILYGGADDKRLHSSTWQWSGRAGWRRLLAGGPGPRAFASMAAAPDLGGIILYGGSRRLAAPETDKRDSKKRKRHSLVLDDLWLWDGARWQSVESGKGPAGRAGATMAYDPEGKRLILFGGYGYDRKGHKIQFADTWTWDGKRWRELRSKDGPTAQSGAAMAYDGMAYGNASGRMALIALNENGTETQAWFLDDKGWTPDGDALTPVRRRPAAAFDAKRKHVVLFGGFTDYEYSNQAMELRSGEWWAVKSRTLPQGRSDAAMAYDPRLGRTLMYGGQDGDWLFGDLWSLDPGGWRQVWKSQPRQLQGD